MTSKRPCEMSLTYETHTLLHGRHSGFLRFAPKRQWCREGSCRHSSWQSKPREKGPFLISWDLWRIRSTQHPNSLGAAICCIYSINKHGPSLRDASSAQLSSKEKPRATAKKNPLTKLKWKRRSIFQVNTRKSTVNSHLTHLAHHCNDYCTQFFNWRDWGLLLSTGKYFKVKESSRRIILGIHTHTHILLPNIMTTDLIKLHFREFLFTVGMIW